MYNQVLYTDSKDAETGLVYQRAYLALASDASVTTASCFGRGITFTKTGTGVYRGTFDGGWVGLAPTGSQGMSITLAEVKPTAAAIWAEVINQDVANGYFEIRTVDGSGVAADTAVAMGINLAITHKNSGVA